MRKYLTFVAFLILPLAFGYVLYEQLMDWTLYSQWAGATGVLALAFLSLAAISRELCRVVLWFPREETVTRASLLGTYLFAAPHVGLFLSTWIFEGGHVEFNNTAWVFPWALGIAALLLLLAVPLRRLLLRGPLAIPRWTVLVATGMALLHGRLLGLVVGRADENERWFSNQLSSRNGHYAIPLFLLAWFLLALFNRFQVRFTSPIPRFSLLTLLLLPCAGFSGFVLHKHWMPWSIERTLAQAEEITNPWGNFHYPAAALSPNGSQAFSAIPEGPALLWDCYSGTSQELHAHTGPVIDARFSPDGKKLAVVTKAQCLFQRENEKAPYFLKRTFPRDSSVPDDVHTILNSDNSFLTSDLNVLWLYDCASLRVGACLPVGTVQQEIESVADYCFSADSTRLLTLSNNQGAYLWETESGKFLAHRFVDFPDLDDGDHERVLCVKSVDGWRLMLEKSDAHFGEFAVATPAMQKISDHLRSFTDTPGFCLSKDHSALILAIHPRDIEVVNLNDGLIRWKRALEIPSEDRSPIAVCCFDSEHVLAQVSGKFEALSLADGKSITTVKSNGNIIDHALRNTPIFNYPKDGVMAIFDPYTLQNSTLYEALTDQVMSPFSSVGRVTLSADRRWLMNVGSKGTVRIWKNRHPPQWWGRAVLPEFWLTLLFSAALLWSIVRDRRLNAATTSGAPARV